MMRLRIFLVGVSVAMHLVVAYAFYWIESDKAPVVKRAKVKIAITKKVIKPPVVEKKKAVPEPKKVKPKPKPKKKRKKRKKPVERQSNKEANKNARRVQGLSKSATVNKGTGMSAPLGNTLMERDRGLRLKDEDIGRLKKDLSQDPRLVDPSQAKLKYTADAEDAGLEGRFVVAVFVSENGDVLEVDLERKIGFGMDAVVMKAAKNAKFFPRRDKEGKSLKAWTSITFDLVLE